MHPIQCSKCGFKLPIITFTCSNCEKQYSKEFKSISLLWYYLTAGIFAIGMGIVTGCLLNGLMVGFFQIFDIKDSNFILYNLLMFVILLLGAISIVMGMKTVFNLVLFRYLLPFVFKHQARPNVSPQG